MKNVELRGKSQEELEKLLKDNRRKLLELHFQKSGGRVKNVRQLREVRRDIARILTLGKEKEFGKVISS